MLSLRHEPMDDFFFAHNNTGSNNGYDLSDNHYGVYLIIYLLLSLLLTLLVSFTSCAIELGSADSPSYISLPHLVNYATEDTKKSFKVCFNFKSTILKNHEHLIYLIIG